MNIPALAMELRAFRQPSVSETGAGSVMPCWTSTSRLELNPSQGEMPGLQAFSAHPHPLPGQAGSAIALDPS